MTRVVRGAALAVAAVVCWALTTGALARLPWPATPDLLLGLVVAIAAARVRGASAPRRGATAGLAVGLLVDLAPPTTTVVGTEAAAYALAGWAAGAVVRLGWRPRALGPAAGGAVSGAVLVVASWALGLLQSAGGTTAPATPGAGADPGALPGAVLAAAVVQLGVGLVLSWPVARWLDRTLDVPVVPVVPLGPPGDHPSGTPRGEGRP